MCRAIHADLPAKPACSPALRLAQRPVVEAKPFELWGGAGPLAKSAKGRVDQFAKPSANGRSLRKRDMAHTAGVDVKRSHWLVRAFRPGARLLDVGRWLPDLRREMAFHHVDYLLPSTMPNRPTIAISGGAGERTWTSA
jgi:hypothetical protein